MSLQRKFNLALCCAFVLGLVLAALSVDQLAERTARRAVLSDASTMMAEVNATIGYTAKQVTPLLEQPMKIVFIPQDVPFYAAQQTFNSLEAERPDYTYRQPALQPTRPSDRPTAAERDIIKRFIAAPGLRSLTIERGTPSGRELSLAEPVRVTDQSCLVCHSTPDAAPQSMIDVYGRANGFGWQLGQTVGALIVSVPERVAFAEARTSLYATMAVITAVFAGVLLLLNLLLTRLIIAPVRDISHSATEISLGNLSTPEFSEGDGDEIASLGASFNRMRRSLLTAMRMIEDDPAR